MTDDEPQFVGRRRVPKIPEIIPAPKRCRVCNDKRITAYVDAQLAKGYSAVFISGVLTSDMSIKIGTAAINSHKKHYIAIPKAAKKAADLAILIRDQVTEAVQEGRLEPTIKDGLAAVQIIDRRAEKTTDRQMFLAMARALAGGGPVGLLEAPDDLVIDGVAVEVG